MLLSEEFLLKKNLKVGLFGLGKSNLGVARYISRKNNSVKFTLRAHGTVNLEKNFTPDRIFVNDKVFSGIDEDVIFFSPSVRRDIPELKAASLRGTVFSSDAELFFEKASGTKFCVTGSDGKSTTTYLISKMLELSGIDSCPAGNYGKSLADFIDSDKTVVAELSSFQLMHLEPRVFRATITNITPNHLDYHKSLEEYISSKLNLFKNADGTVIDCDGKILTEALPGRNFFAVTSLTQSYGELIKKFNSENYVTYSDGMIHLNGKPYIDISGALRREKYNIRNFILSAATVLGTAKEDAIREAINTFPGLSHRAEIIAQKDGIKYIDSSIDSSPERTAKTLLSLEGNTVVIISGKNKGLDYSSLARTLPSITKGAVLMGDVGKEIGRLVSAYDNTYRIVYTDNMTDAVKEAKKLLFGFGNIILSPAGTSFDLYKNFEERGEDFKKIVNKIIQ